MKNIRTRCFLALAVAAALAAAGCATGGMEAPVQAPAAEAAEPEAAMAEAEMQPEASEAAMAETAMPDTEITERAIEPEAPAPAMAEAEMPPEPPVTEAPAAAMAEAEPPVTEAPREFGVGTVRTYNYTINGDTYEIAITIAEKRRHKRRTMDLHVFSAPYRDPGGPCNGANNVLEDVATASYAGCLKDGRMLAAASPHDGRLKWPMQVGNTWRSRHQFIDRVLHPDWSGPSWQRFEVAAWEEVTVPAGAFMAYRVARTGANWDTVHDEEYVIWYAPDPGLIVKLDFSRSPANGYGASQQGWELVSHDLK